MTMMCQCRFILGKKKIFFSILASDVDNREGYIYLGDKEYMQIYVHLSFFWQEVDLFI